MQTVIQKNEFLDHAKATKTQRARRGNDNLVNVAVIFIPFVGNLLVMLVVTFNRIFHKMKHFLQASLALSDFIFVTCIHISRLVSLAYREWIFGEEMCQGIAFLVRILYVNTFFHLCAVSYERYLAIVKDHLTYDGRITAKRIVLSTIALWILPTIISHGPFLGWGAFEYKPIIYACGQRFDSETTFPFLLMFIAPLLFIYLLNYKVFQTARQLEREVRIRLGSINEINVQMTPQDKQFTDRKGIICQHQDEGNLEVKSQKEETFRRERAVTEEVAGENPYRKMWNYKFCRAKKVNLEPYQSSAQHVHIIKCSDDYHPETNQPHPPPGPERDVVPAVAQQGNQLGAKKTLATGGLVKILKECRAARDVMITAGALVVCFLPVWIFNIYYMFKDEAPSSVEMLSINSLYCTTTIRNPIIYSVRMKQFRQAVRKMFKIQHE